MWFPMSHTVSTTGLERPIMSSLFNLQTQWNESRKEVKAGLLWSHNAVVFWHMSAYCSPLFYHMPSIQDCGQNKGKCTKLDIVWNIFQIVLLCTVGQNSNLPWENPEIHCKQYQCTASMLFYVFSRKIQVYPYFRIGCRTMSFETQGQLVMSFTGFHSGPWEWHTCRHVNNSWYSWSLAWKVYRYLLKCPTCA